MSPLELLAYQAEWATKDTAHNLDFIPADKLAWKPAPTAKSALEVVNEMVGFAKGLTPVLSGGSFTPPQFTPATTAAAAKELLISTGRDYAQALRDVKPEDMGRKVDLGFGTFTLGQAAGMAVIEFIHHRGQVVYIETLLGDTQDHFDMSAL
jgi:DinB family protein